MVGSDIVGLPRGVRLAIPSTATSPHRTHYTRMRGFVKQVVGHRRLTVREAGAPPQKPLWGRE